MVGLDLKMGKDPAIGGFDQLDLGKEECVDWAASPHVAPIPLNMLQGGCFRCS